MNKKRNSEKIEKTIASLEQKLTLQRFYVIVVNWSLSIRF